MDELTLADQQTVLTYDKHARGLGSSHRALYYERRDVQRVFRKLLAKHVAVETA
jgi:hypothetical protein